MNLLIAVDLSDSTPAVVATGRSLALATGARSWIVHVATPDPDFVGYDAGPQSVRDQLAHSLRGEHKRVEDLARDMRADGLECTGLLVRGPTVEAILEEARSVGADIIVVGSHQKGAVKRALLGSVSEGILHRADVPVLVVPPHRRG
jgi:nucleotide-binding universal stress UspA family protein